MNILNKTNWVVKVSKKVNKDSLKIPSDVQILFLALVIDLENMGPVQKEWPNYSKLTHGRYHCHLNYRFVAVWEVVDKEVRILEVTYVGGRKDAPY